MNQQQQEEAFSEIILQNVLPPASNGLKKNFSQAINPLSMFEVLNMANQITHSKWYQELEKEALEITLNTHRDGQTLSNEQKRIAEKFLDTAWHKFQMHTEEEKLHHQIQYSNGIPVSIDIGIYRDETITELRNILTKLQRKKLWPLPNDIFNSWKRKNILAIFDLQMWFKIPGIKYSKSDIGRIIWGNTPPESPTDTTYCELQN